MSQLMGLHGPIVVVHGKIDQFQNLISIQFPRPDQINSQPCLTLPLNEESRHSVVINTHKGHFRYTQLSFFAFRPDLQFSKGNWPITGHYNGVLIFSIIISQFSIDEVLTLWIGCEM